MAWKYVGDGDEFIPGIPARDLSDAEVKDLGVSEDVEASPLYEKSNSRSKKTDEGAK
jgi:hypothetical protein